MDGSSASSNGSGNVTFFVVVVVVVVVAVVAVVVVVAVVLIVAVVAVVAGPKPTSPPRNPKATTWIGPATYRRQVELPCELSWCRLPALFKLCDDIPQGGHIQFLRASESKP